MDFMEYTQDIGMSELCIFSGPPTPIRGKRNEHVQKVTLPFLNSKR